MKVIVLFYLAIAQIAAKRWLRMAVQKPTTYTSVAINSPKLPIKRLNLLVKESERSILDTIELWNEETDLAEEETIQRWVDSGLAFLSTAEGQRAIYKKEQKLAKTSIVTNKPRRRPMAADVYVNAGTEEEPIYIKSSKSGFKDSWSSEHKELYIDKLKKKGEAFTNVTHLFTEERILHRAGAIATRLKEEFPIDSPEWGRWTNKTSQYNMTSLTQVIGEYYREQSIGDVGGPEVNYVPRAGFPGTLAPGEMFKEDAAFEDLDKRVLHPWPAMQQFQFHVRWPPSHPMIAPPLLWIGLCNMYTENYTQWMLNVESNETVGGLAMEAKDAVRIAKYANFGNCFVPEDQIAHGGMEFPSGHVIPNYHPDHGPTVSEEDAKTPIPKHLLPITEAWLDPYFGLDLDMMQPPTKGFTDVDASADVQWRGNPMGDDEMEEEERRKAMVEKMFLENKPDWKLEEETQDQLIEDEVAVLVAEEQT
jgi:hypothetical protein